MNYAFIDHFQEIAASHSAPIRAALRQRHLMKGFQVEHKQAA
jgi:hypothetical protein